MTKPTERPGSVTDSSAPFLTRFAPSPTGRLHLGHVANAIFVWGLAKRMNGQVLLRMEDHDRGRYRPAFERAILDDLEWLGFHPDFGSFSEFRTGPTPFRQSDAFTFYENAVSHLRRDGIAYACECSRSQIADSVDVDRRATELRYGGRCRNRGLEERTGRGLRVIMPDGVWKFHDRLVGEQCQQPTRQCGDMLLRDRVGNWTYQLTVVVDDIRHGVTAVIRGEDLLWSTGRQLALRALLGERRPLAFWHHPLIRENGRKLSKRDGDLGLDHMRRAGARPSQVLGDAAFLVGLIRKKSTLQVADLADLFEPGV